MLPSFWPQSRWFFSKSSVVYAVGGLLWMQGVLCAQEETLGPIALPPPSVGLSQTAELSQKTDILVCSKDLLLYRVLEDRDPPIKLQVSEGGTIVIPYYGELAVAGKTLEELRLAITLALESSFYKKATVFLQLEQDNATLSPQLVYLGGKVNKVGAVPLDPMKKNTVTRVILAAGGFADFADDTQVKVVRKVPDTGMVKTFQVDVAAVLEKGELDKDLDVLDGDFIIVPKRLFNW